MRTAHDGTRPVRRCRYIVRDGTHLVFIYMHRQYPPNLNVFRGSYKDISVSYRNGVHLRERPRIWLSAPRSISGMCLSSCFQVILPGVCQHLVNLPRTRSTPGGAGSFRWHVILQGVSTMVLITMYISNLPATLSCRIKRFRPFFSFKCHNFRERPMCL